MANLARSMKRKHKHARIKCINKVKRQFNEIKSRTSLSDAEACDFIVKELSHKNLRLISYEAEYFKAYLFSSNGNIGEHLVNLVHSALLERSICSIKTNQINSTK